MKIRKIPPIIHLICLPPYPADFAKENLDRITSIHHDFNVMLHTEIPKDFIFQELPVFGPAQLSALLRMDVLRRFGGWYFDLDVHAHCHVDNLQKVLSLGNKLAITKNPSGVCTFISCCPENWNGWDIVVPYLKSRPKSAPGHYCTAVMGKLLEEKPFLCDFIPSDFTYSNRWLSHKGINH